MSEQVTNEVAPEINETIQDSSENVTEIQDSESIEQNEEIKESIQEEIDSAKTPEEEAAAIKKMINFKSNGKDYKFDLSNEKQLQELIKMAQLGDGSQAKMQEAAEQMKAWKKYQEELKTNPWDIIEELGIDADELAIDRINKLVEEEEKSPEQKEQERIQKELEVLREQLKEKETKEQEAEMFRLQMEAEKDLDVQITEALASTNELPKTPYVVRRIADAMLYAMDHGYENITAQQVLPIVQKEINDEIQAMLDLMPDQVMEKYIGQKQLERLRKNRLNKVKQTQNINNIKEVGQTPIVEEKVKKMTPQESRDFFRNLGR